MSTPNRLWRDEAACAQPGIDPELFFAPDGEKPAACALRLRAARAVCSGCPVRAVCAEQAVMEPWTQHGARAGLSTLELRRRRKARAEERRTAAAAEAA